jgi:hypothetical protein
MHSDFHIIGRAVLVWPFLLLLIQMHLSAMPEHPGADKPPVLFDSGVYVSRIYFTEPERLKVWTKAGEFAAELKLPEKIENTPVIDELNKKINAMFGFYLYKQTAFLKQVDGVITAELKILIEEEKMVAIIDNIYFVDYARNRYGKFSPKSSRKYSYEEIMKKQKDMIWQDHLSTIDEKMNLLLIELQKSVNDEKEASKR